MDEENLAGLHPLFDCLTDGVCVTNSEGRLLYANDAARLLLGGAVEEAVKTSICAALCSEFEVRCDEARSCPLKVLHGPDDSRTLKGRFVHTDRELRVRCFRARLPSVERHFIMIEDVTAQADVGRRTEEWRQMFAHDLRSPLAVAFGTLRAIADMGAGHRLAGSDLSLIEGGVRNCRRVESLIGAYLDTTKLEEGRVPMHAEIVDLNALTRAIKDELAPAALARRQTLTFAVPPGLAARADLELLRRALVNIVGNAVKFAPYGGRIEVGAEARGRDVLIRVSDNGPGISPEDLPRIFDRYYQGTAAGKSKGLGLGLTFCRAAARAMGGDVEVESTKGQGAAFTLRLPQASSEGGSP